MIGVAVNKGIAVGADVGIGGGVAIGAGAAHAASATKPIATTRLSADLLMIRNTQHAIPPYFSTPVITTPCMNWRWAKKNISAGRMRVSAAVAAERPG